MSAALFKAIRAQYRLEGEHLVRTRDGKRCGLKARTDGRYAQVLVHLSADIKRLLYAHRVKFFLLHGYMPERVDHKNRDRSDNSKDNLRAATHRQNQANIPRSRDCGVRKRASGRFQAYYRDGTKQRTLGTYNTKEEALEVAQAKRREEYGEFYDG